MVCLVIRRIPRPEIPHLMRPTIKLEDLGLTFSEEDIVKACKDLDISSAPGPDGIPSRILKEAADALAKPISMIWRESFQLKRVPDY